MSDDFIILLENSNSFKKYLNEITKDNIYCYWCDKEELEKISSNIESNYSFLSFFLSSKHDKINELVNNGHILIFLKNPKILYGIVKVESIIIKNLLKNNYLEEDDINNTNEINNNKLILIDENKFNELLKQYKIVEVPKMMFIKFKCIYKFKFEISIKKFNDFINKSEFKYPRCVQNKEMIKCININFLDNLNIYIDNLSEQDINNQNNEILVKIDPKNNIENQSHKFCIPVLWNYCNILKDKLDNLKFDKKHKKFFISHYTNCEICEINDNNNKFIDILNNDIFIKNINNDSDIQIFDLLINSYKNIENLIIDREYEYLELKKGKINIIQCPKSKTIYKNCLFIVK